MEKNAIINWKKPGYSTEELIKKFKFPDKIKVRYPPRRTDINVSQRGSFDDPDPSNFNLITVGQTGAAKVDKSAVVRYLKACRIVFDNKIPYVFDGRTYVRANDNDIARMIYQGVARVDPTLFVSRNTVNDIIANLAAISTKYDIDVPDGWDSEGKYDTMLIPFDNGLYSVDLDEMLPFTPHVFIRHRLATMYLPNVQDDPVEEIYRKIIPNPRTLDFFFEMVGFMMYSPDLKPPSIFLTYGPGQTGKSALQETVTKAVGRSNVSTLDLTQISGTFTTAEMQDKLINVCGETGSGVSRDISKADGELLKRLTDGQTITVQRKNKDPYEMRNTAKLWFVSNTLPDFGDTSSGLLRRLYIIPCRERQNWEDQIYDKLQSEYALIWLMNRAMKGYIDFLNRGGKFEVSDEMRKEKRSYKTQDSIMDYFEYKYSTSEPVIVTDKLHGEYLNSIYDEYRAFTADGGGKAFSKRKFSEKVRNEYQVETVKVRGQQENGKPTNMMMFVKT